jgi:hypothetical protein
VAQDGESYGLDIVRQDEVHVPSIRARARAARTRERLPRGPAPDK